MERTSYLLSNCSMARSLQVLGEKWTLLIVREAFSGSTRFEQFHSVLGCPRNLLSERLRKLVDEEILEPADYRETGSRPRKEYHLTERGRELLPILLALREWGDRHKADPAGPAAINRAGDAIAAALGDLAGLSGEDIVAQRADKFLAIGRNL